MRRIWSRIIAWAKALAYFPDYCRALRQHWIEVTFGPGMLAIIYVIWSAFATPPKVVTLAFFGGAVVVASYYVWLSDHLRLIPKITLRFEDREPFIQPTPTEVTGRGSPLSLPGANRVYIRIFPECTTPVDNCEAFLLAVYREENGNWVPTPINEACRLTWANRSTGSLSVHPGIGPYVDVFYVEEGKNEIFPCTSRLPLRARGAYPRSGTYRFDVQVTNSDPIALRVRPGTTRPARPLQVEVINLYPASQNGADASPR